MNSNKRQSLYFEVPKPIDAFQPSSAHSSQDTIATQIPKEAWDNLNTTIKSFLDNFEIIDGLEVETIEISVTFSLDLKAFIISSSANTGMKLVLKKPK